MRYLVALILLAACSTHTRAAELSVFASVAARDLIEELLPEWKARTGSKPVIEYNSAAALRKQVTSGAPFDVIVSFAPDLEDMRKLGLTETAGTFVGTAYLVIVYKRGADAPKATTLNEFKAFIESAPSFAMGDPALGGVGPVLIAETARNMGLQQTLKDKMVIVNPGQSAVAVSDGRARFAVAQTTEIARVRDVAGSKLLPENPRTTTRLVAGVGAKSVEKAVAERFVAFITSAESIKARRDAGFEVP